jgi:hypothetical protein
LSKFNPHPTSSLFFEISEQVFALIAIKCQGIRCESGTVAPL